MATFKCNWTVDQEDLAEAFAELCENTLISWGGGNDDQAFGFDLVDGSLLVEKDTRNERKFNITFTVKLAGVLPSGSWMSPHYLLGNEPWDWGHSRQKEG